ncbi:MAG: PucR family transcriptional regulator [Acutalibacter sp.]|jgi:sugar diacid utilization regulator
MDMLGFYREILDLLPKGDLQNLLETAYRYLNKPLLVTDVTYHLLGIYPKRDTGDGYWDYLLHHGQYGAEIIFQLYEDKIMQSADQHQLPYLVNWGRAARDMPKVVGPIQVEGRTEGYLCLQWGLGECPEEVLGAVGILQKACEVLFRGRQIRSSLHTVEQKAFAEELLSGKISSRAQLEQWHRNMGFYPSGNYMVFVTRTAGEGESTVLTSLYGQVEKLFPQQLSFLRGQELYLLRYHVESAPEEDVRVETFQKLLGRFHCECGASDSFSDLLRTPDYLRQAQDALRLGHLSQREEVIFPYREFALLATLRSGTEELPPANALHPALGKLEEYDRQHHTEFLRTLEAYIRHLGRPGPVVEELHIHRNSLPYRIGKIQEITGCSLSDFETVLHLAVNFYLHWQQPKGG